MKNKYLYIFVVVLLATACSKTTDYAIDRKTPDERLSKTMEDFQKLLTGSPYGWTFFETSSAAYNGGQFDSIINSFTYLVTFREDQSVTMYGDFDSVQATTPKTSSYYLKALQRPTIIFDTRNYIHVPGDPDNAISKGVLNPGSGWGVDFQFQLSGDKEPAEIKDTIWLRGIYNQSKAFMVRATQADQQLFSSGQFYKNLKAIRSIDSIQTYWKRFEAGGVTYELTAPNFALKTIGINRLDGSGNLQSKMHHFHYGADGGLMFNEPIVNGSTVINGFTNINYDGTKVNVTFAGTNAAGAIVPATAALKYDTTSAQKWWDRLPINFNNCWVSDNAFHANGVDDFCKFTSVSGYNTFWFGGADFIGYPGGGILAFNGAGFFAPFSVGGAPPVITNGIARFTLLGSGSFTGTSPIVKAMTAARLLMYGGATGGSSQTWYFVPTSTDGKAYDMVRYPDATAWISWRLR